MNGFFITGTDTDVGKTIITALLARGLQKRGHSICPVKPIGAGGIAEDGRIVSDDARVFHIVANTKEPLTKINPLCFKKPASPHFAAMLEGGLVPIEEVITSLEQLAENYEALLVEGIGGWLVPLTMNFTVADFAHRLNLPVIIVSANRLGTLNHTLLTIEAIRRKGLTIAGVIFDETTEGVDPDIAENNIETIQKMGDVEILGVIPFLDPLDLTKPDELLEKIESRFQWDRIHQLLFHAKT